MCAAGRQSLLDSHVVVGVLARVKFKGRVVNGTELPEEQKQEDRAGENVEDAVPDHLKRDRDNVAALGTSLRGRVGDQHEGQVACTDEVPDAKGAADGEGTVGCVPEEDKPKRKRDESLQVNMYKQKTCQI
jgi:hypothetical protein